MRRDGAGPFGPRGTILHDCSTAPPPHFTILLTFHSSSPPTAAHISRLPASHSPPPHTALHLPRITTSSPPFTCIYYAYTRFPTLLPHCSLRNPPPTLLPTSHTAPHLSLPHTLSSHRHTLVLTPISTTPPLSSLILVSLDSPLQPHFHTPLLPLPTPSHCFLLAPPLPSCTPLLLQALLGEGFDQDRS